METLISLVMIVRNEETHLPKCLESIHSEVDEIIIVDTGSTDRTREIALNYTEKVHTFSWNNDFSAARNFALQKASGQWVLSLDADEFLDLKPGELRTLVLANPTIEAYLLPLYNPTSENTGEYNLFHVLRLFRNNGLYFFSGQIHEQVNIPNEHVVDLALSPSIRHQFLPLKERHHKRERNLNALKKSLFADPQNPFLHYYMGVEWMMLNKPKKALPHLRESYQSLPEEMVMFRTSTLRYLIIALHSSGETHKALKLILEGNENYSHYSDILYLGGVLFQEIQEYALGIKWLKEGISSGPPPSLYSHLTGSESFLAYFQLGICYERLGEITQAQNSYLSSLQSNPSYIFPLYPLMNLLIEQRGPRQTFNFLHAQNLLLHHSQALAAAQIFFMLGYPGLSLRCLDSLNDSASQAEYRMALGKYQLFSGEIHSSLKILTFILNQESSNSSFTSYKLEIQIYILIALLLIGNFPKAHSIALELWKNRPTRCEGYTLIALITLMEKGKLIPLPHVVRDSKVPAFLEALYRDLLNYLPKLPQDPNTLYVRMMECLQTLIKSASPAGGMDLKKQIESQSRELKTSFQRKFGTGWDIL